MVFNPLNYAYLPWKLSKHVLMSSTYITTEFSHLHKKQCIQKQAPYKDGCVLGVCADGQSNMPFALNCMKDGIYTDIYNEITITSKAVHANSGFDDLMIQDVADTLMVQDLENTKQMFRPHFAVGIRKGNPKFILDNATDALPSAVIEVPVEETVVTEMAVGNITHPPNTDEPPDKKCHKGKPVSTIVRKKLFTSTDQDESGPDAKKLKHE